MHNCLNDLITFENESINSEISENELFKKISVLDNKYKDDVEYEFNINGTLINIASSLGYKNVLKCSIKRLTKLVEKYNNGKLIYDLGNAIHCVADMDVPYPRSIPELINTTKFNEARKYYDQVIESDICYPQAVTNSSNILDQYGRNLESIYQYDKLTKIHPDFGMALCNKARAIEYYVQLAPSQSLRLLDIARSLYIKGLSDPNLHSIGGSMAVSQFEKRLTIISNHLNNNSYTHINDEQPKKLSKYLKFCLENNLFLNYDFGLYYDKQSICDNFFPSFIQSFSDITNNQSTVMSDKIYFSFHAFNQILESYSSARFQYFSAISINHHKIDHLVKYAYTFDLTQHSHKYGIMKSTLSTLYNCLDKLAHLIYYYYIGIDKGADKSIYFNWLLSEDFRQIIIEKNCYQLLALWSLARDFETENKYSQFRSIRNRITHSFININMDICSGSNFQEYEITENFLLDAVDQMFLIVKSALMYTVNSLSIETKNSNFFKMNATFESEIFK